MKKKLFIPLSFILFATSAFCQNLDTVHIRSFKINHSQLPLTSLYSNSNTLYTNVTNILQINYTDTSYYSYYLTTEIGFIKDLGHGRFMVVKYKPGNMTISVYRKDPRENSLIVAGQQFDVKPLPDASLTVGGEVIDSTVSAYDLESYRRLGLTFGDFIPSPGWCYIDSFDVKVDSITYHSSSDKLTPAMISAIQKTRKPIVFENVIASINSDNDIDQSKSIAGPDGKRKPVQKWYSVEQKSKPIRLIR